MTGHGARGAGLNGMGEDNRQVSEKGMNGAHLSSCEQDSSALETAARRCSCIIGSTLRACADTCAAEHPGGMAEEKEETGGVPATVKPHA